MRNMIELMEKIITTKFITMNNTLLEKQANNLKDDIISIINDLMIEIKDLDPAYEKGYHTLFLPLVNYAYKAGEKNALQRILRKRLVLYRRKYY